MAKPPEQMMVNLSPQNNIQISPGSISGSARLFCFYVCFYVCLHVRGRASRCALSLHQHQQDDIRCKNTLLLRTLLSSLIKSECYDKRSFNLKLLKALLCSVLGHAIHSKSRTAEVAAWKGQESRS